MRKMQFAGAVLGCAWALAACGGGGDPAPAPTTPKALLAGQTLTMTAGQSINVPKGTIVNAPGGNTITLAGDNSTLNTSAGAVVSVPATSTGPADNVITAQ